MQGYFSSEASASQQAAISWSAPVRLVQSAQPRKSGESPAEIKDDVYDDDESAGIGSAAGENTGRWANEEHELFLRGLELYGKGWKKIANLIKTRTVVQIRTHAQKHFQKLSKVELCVHPVYVRMLPSVNQFFRWICYTGAA